MTSEAVSLITTIRGLVARAAPRKLTLAIDPGNRLRDDLGFDSIGLMTLAFELETAFDVDLSEHTEQYLRVATVDDVVRFVDAVLRGDTARGASGASADPGGVV